MLRGLSSILTVPLPGLDFWQVIQTCSGSASHLQGEDVNNSTHFSACSREPGTEKALWVALIIGSLQLAGPCAIWESVLTCPARTSHPQVPLCPRSLSGSLLPLSSLPCPSRAYRQDIRARSAAWKTDSLCSTEAGSLPGNVRKNRYKDVLPCKSRPRERACSVLALASPARFETGLPVCFLRVRPGIPSAAPPKPWQGHLDGNLTRGAAPAGFHLGGCWGLGTAVAPKSCVSLSCWQMIRHEWSSPCCMRRATATTSMATSSGSGWESGKGWTWWRVTAGSR